MIDVAGLQVSSDPRVALMAAGLIAEVAKDLLKGRQPVRHDLKSGAWIEIRPLQDLKGKDKDRFNRAVRQELPLDGNGEFDKETALALRLNDREVRRNAAIACLISAWSFILDDGSPLPVPGLDDFGAMTNKESFGDYPLGDQDEIEELLEPYLTKLRPPDPKEATISASNGRSKAKAGSLKG